MFSGRHSVVPSGGDGSVFVDRDGRHFAAVLNFLRDGQVPAGAVVPVCSACPFQGGWFACLCLCYHASVYPHKS